MFHFYCRIDQIIFSLGLIVFLTGCALHPLTVQTQYFTQEDLASYHVGTPDPQIDHPSVGQRLLIQWSLCAKELQNEQISLFLKVRFRNRHEEQISFPIDRSNGTYVYTIKDERFKETGGILTYFVEITDSSHTIACWKHPLWVPLIILNVPEKQSQPILKEE